MPWLPCSPGGKLAFSACPKRLPSLRASFCQVVGPRSAAPALVGPGLAGAARALLSLSAARAAASSMTPRLHPGLHTPRCLCPLPAWSSCGLAHRVGCGLGHGWYCQPLVAVGCWVGRLLDAIRWPLVPMARLALSSAAKRAIKSSALGLVRPEHVCYCQASKSTSCTGPPRAPGLLLAANSRGLRPPRLVTIWQALRFAVGQYWPCSPRTPAIIKIWVRAVPHFQTITGPYFS